MRIRLSGGLLGIVGIIIIFGISYGIVSTISEKVFKIITKDKKKSNVFVELFFSAILTAFTIYLLTLL